MRSDKVNASMEQLVGLFRTQNFSQCFEKAGELISEIKSEKIIDATVIGWPIHYQAKCLYEMKRFGELYLLLSEKSNYSFICQTSTKNAAYHASVMMEVCWKTAHPDEIIDWADICFRQNLENNASDNFRNAVDTSLKIVQAINDPELIKNLGRLWVKIGEAYDLSNLTKSGQNLIDD